MKPALIGIPTYGRNDDGHFFLPAEYVESVRRSGASPILLPPGEEHIDRWFELVDGFLFPGGGDIEPARYGGGEHEMIYMVDPERDTTELALLERALDSGLPTLGICRGTQLLNVALGGTLFDHLPDHVGEEVDHRLPPREPTPTRWRSRRAPAWPEFSARPASPRNPGITRPSTMLPRDSPWWRGRLTAPSRP